MLSVTQDSVRTAKALALAGASLIAFAAAPALAQDANSGPVGTAASPAPVAAPAPSSQLEDIVVTARRINENVQTTPVSVSAVSAAQIQNLNIVRLDNLQQLAPNLTVIQNGPSSVAPLLYIRGIGSNSVALYSEPPVAIYIDGVYTPRPTAAAFDLPDLDGAEVLRGPQGTLFGRNTTGGAILLKTQEPRADAGASFRASYGSDNDFIGSAVLHTGNLGDTGIRAKIVLQDHDRDGWVKFPGYDKDEWGGSLHSYGGSFTLADNLTDNFSVNNALSYSKLKSAVGWQSVGALPTAIAYFNQSPSLGGPPFLLSTDPLDLTYRSPRLTQNEASIKSLGDRLILDYDGGDAFHLKSISAYSKIDENLTGQLGGSYVLGRVNRLGATVIEPVVTHVTPDEPGTQRQYSQEFNVNGKFGDFSYVGGLYYFHEKVGETIHTFQISIPGAVATAPVVVTDRSVIYTGRTKSYAAYGQASWKPSALDQKLEITGGIRYTDDKKTNATETFATASSTGVTVHAGANAAGAFVATGAVGPLPGKDSWDNVGWLGSASYEVADQIFVYARASSSFRAGGFNSGSTGAPSYGPEKAKTYEGGFKSEFFDRHLRLNASVYTTDYNDLQLNGYVPARQTNFITNAGKARFSGFEIESTAILGAGFQVDGDYGRISPKYKSYVVAASPLPAACAANPTGPTCTTDAAGVAHFPQVSRSTWHIGGQWASPETSFGIVTLRGDYGYRSSTRLALLDATAPNGALQRSGTDENLSARIILSEIPLGSGKTKFRAQVFGDNLTNHRYYVNAVDFGTTLNAIYNRPRNYGVILSADF